MIHQIERHPYWQQKHMVEKCKKLGIHVQASGPLANAIGSDDVLTKIAAAHGMSPYQVALQWNIQGGHSVTPRITTTNLTHVKENIDVLRGNVGALTYAEMAQIDALDTPKLQSKCWPSVGGCSNDPPSSVELSRASGLHSPFSPQSCDKCKSPFGCIAGQCIG